jgi:signal transduction histidine kinase
MNKSRILVIDDEAGIRQGCVRVLQPAGFDVEIADSFQAGLQKIQKAPFDLVLIDVMLPDGRGIDLLGPIRERDPETVPIIITGYATVELAVDTIKKGAYNFISKPFTADMLLMTVNQGLEKRHLSMEAKRLKELENEKAELARAIEEAKKLNEFKSSFLLMVAHDLRSPLSGAQSLVRTLLRGYVGELKPQQAELLSRIEARLDFLLTMINDILTLASSKTIETEQPLESIQVQPLVQKIIESFSEEAKNHQLVTKFNAPSQAVAVLATINGLDTVLRNLIGNAIKYSKPGGTVEANVQEEEDRVIISISDTGIGIPEEDLPHIWDEFFRAKNAHVSGITGTGLGLSIVKQFVDRFGGQVNATSRIGEGTTFTVSLKKYK